MDWVVLKPLRRILEVDLRCRSFSTEDVHVGRAQHETEGREWVLSLDFRLIGFRAGISGLAFDPSWSRTNRVVMFQETMAPRRRSSSRSAREGTSDVPEQVEASGGAELREQLATLVGVVRQQAEVVQRQQEVAMRQEEQIKELHELLARQAAAATPVAARRVPTGIAMDSGAVAPGSMEVEAEKERALAALMAFKRFDPPTFDGENVDPWIVEMWIDSMETHFEELYTLERDKVPLAVHCLKQSAKAWWKGIRRDRSPSLPPMAWEEFRGLVFSTYFPDTEKRKLQDKFRKLRQGNRSVREYEREFSRIVNVVPNVVRDDKDRADWFRYGLRPEIYKRVQIFQLTTFAEVLNRALWAEHGEAFVREERESRRHERGGVMPLSSGSGGQSSFRHHSRSSSTRSSSGCVICGGSHQARRCALRDGRCIRCGQPGHMRDECPQGESQALMMTTAFSSPRQFVDVQPLARSGERGGMARQPEGSRRAPSGHGYATQVEEPAATDDAVAGMS